ncbi:MAG: MerR family transcriptional regulator [Calditrichaeota bacterium]|nr:MAG: MerR family transcriptional regulator [Calditrichota bacterium]
MTIHELIQKSGFNRRTIYYYTQIGLLPAPEGKGRRFSYSEEHLKRLQQIRLLQSKRFSLKEIKQLLDAGQIEDVLPQAQEKIHSFIIANQLPPQDFTELSLAKQKEIWRRIRITDHLEIHLRWPPDAKAIQYLKSNWNDILTQIMGDLA